MEKTFTIGVADVAESFVVEASDWTAAGLTLVLDGGTLHLYETGTSIDAVPPHALANVTDVNAIGRDTDGDALTIDFSGGNPIPDDGVTFGGGTSAGDYLTLASGAFSAIIHNYTGLGSGIIVLDTGSSSIHYAGIESISDDLTATVRDNVFLGGSEQITLGDDAPGSPDRSAIDSTAGTPTTFRNPQNGLRVQAENGADQIVVAGLDPAFAGRLILGTGDEAGQVRFSGSLDYDGQLSVSGTQSIEVAAGATINTHGGAILLSAERDIVLNDGSRITTVDGNVTLSGNQGETPISGNFVGIDINGATIEATGSGQVILEGRGGNSLNNNYGICVQSGGQILGGSGAVTVRGTGGSGSGQYNRGVEIVNGIITSAGSGVITVEGTGGSGGNTNSGVAVYGTGGRITSGGGNVTVQGTGGSTRGNNYGVSLWGSGTITAGGSGDVTVSGSGGDGTSLNYGVYVNGSNTQITSGGGDVQVIGYGGNGTGGSSNHGVAVFDGGQITASGNGTVTVNGSGGTRGSMANQGVTLRNSRITSGGGDVQVTGIAGAGPSSFGIRLDTSVAITTSGSGNVSLTADSMDIQAGVDAQTRLVTLTPLTSGLAVNLGGADSATQLGLTNEELNQITAGVLRIGNGSAGDITISSFISPAGTDTLHLISGGEVGIAYAKGITVGNLAVEAGGTVNLSNNSSNLVDTIAITTPGVLFFDNNVGFTVGELDGVAGIAGSGMLRAISGDVLISDTSAGDDIRANSTFGIILNGDEAKFSLASGARIFASAQSYSADKMDLQGTIISRSYVLLKPKEAGEAINLGATGDAATGTLELSDAELDTITTERLRIGSSASGPITISGVLSPAGTDTLHLTTGGGVSQTAPVTVTNLAVTAGGEVTLENVNNDLDTVAIKTTTGNVTFVDRNAFNVGFVYAVNGIHTENGNVQLTANAGNVTIYNLLNVSDIEATGDITITLDGSDALFTTNTGAEVKTTGGGVTVTADQMNLAGIIDAANSLQMHASHTGAGTYVLSGTVNAIEVVVNEGTLRLGAADRVADNAAVVLVTSGQAVLDLNGFDETIGSLSGSGDVTLGSGTLTTGGNNATTTYHGVISGSGGVVKQGTGSFVVGGENTYSGVSEIRSGNLYLVSQGALGDTAGDTLVADGASLIVARSAVIAEDLRVQGEGSVGVLSGIDGTDFAGSVTLLGDSRFDVGNANSTVTFSGPITDGGAGYGVTLFTFSDTTRTFIFSGTNDYSGRTIVNSDAALRLGSTEGIPDASSVSVNPSATLDLNDFDTTIGSLSGSGAVNLGSGTLTTGGDNGSTTFSGVISGSGGLVKEGTGTLTLTNNETMLGTVSVSDGILQVDGSIIVGGTVTVSGGILAGSGSIAGPVSVLSGGEIAPGLGPRILSTRSVSWNPGSTYSVELNGEIPGTDHDQLSVTGTVDAGSATLDVSLGYTPTPTSGDSFVIVDNDGTDAVTGAFDGLPHNARFMIDGTKVRISYTGGDGNDIELMTFVQVSGGGGKVEVFADDTDHLVVKQGTVLFRQPLDSVSGLSLQGSAESDTFEVTIDGLTPEILPSGIWITGGEGTDDNDTLRIRGSRIIKNHNYTTGGPEAGTITLDGFTIGFEEFEPIYDNLDATNRVLTIGTSGDQTIRITDNGDPNDGISVIYSEGTGGFESIEFVNPTGSLQVNAGDGNDTVVLDALEDDFTVPVEVNGGSGSDTLDASAFSGETTLNGGEDDDHLVGGTGANVLDGGDGDDTLEDTGGTNTVIAGSGNNSFVPGGGVNTFETPPGSTVPNVFGDTYRLADNIPLTIVAAEGVLANDVAPNSDPLLAQMVTPTANGVLVLTSEGSFIYTPEVGFRGTDTFSYHALSDGNANSNAVVTIVVDNAPPAVGAISAPIAPLPVGTEISVSASFTDPGVLDTHTAQWQWGNDTGTDGTVTETGGSGTVVGSYTYDVPGVYTVTLTVTDNDGDSHTADFQYVVVYDPDGGFVTGGGWIDSPEGAYTPDPNLTGKANFGFVSKYKKGATTPTGQTQFQFKVADLDFHSNDYEWLVIVVSGARAKYKGSGTINGEGDYGFMITVTDGQLNGGGGEDKFRIKIWDKATEETVYDNKLGAADDSYDGTELGGGSIVIHDGGDQLQAASGISTTMAGSMLTQQTLAPVVDQAIAYWTAHGSQSDGLARLNAIDVLVADFSGSVLGIASSSNLIWIDRDAAGYGWSTGPDRGSQAGGMNLLSAVTHEFGHKLGFDHDALHGVMAPALAPNIQTAVTSAPLDLSHTTIDYAHVVSLRHSSPMISVGSSQFGSLAVGLPGAGWHLAEPSRAVRLRDQFFQSLAVDNRQAALIESRFNDNTGTDRQRGMLYDWSLTVNPATPLSTESAAASTASAVDQGLLAWLEPDSSDDEDINPLAAQAADELALMMME